MRSPPDAPSTTFDNNSVNSDGTLKWAFATAAPVVSSPATDADGTIYVGSNDFNLYAVHTDGTLKWVFPTVAPVVSSPITGTDGTIYVGSNDFNLYAINAGPATYTSYFQAESGTIISSFEVAADLQVSDGAYVTTAAGAPTLTTGTTEITIPVDLPAGGAYYIWARVLGPAPDQDASYVGIDGNFGRVFPSSTGVWQWVAIEVTDGSGDYAHILSVGPHQLVLGHGEAQAQIDVLMITNDASLLPTTDDVVITLPAFGTWRYLNNTTWLRLDDAEAGLVAIADLDGNGPDDLIVTFPGEGTWRCTSSAGMGHMGYPAKRQLEPMLIGRV